MSELINLSRELEGAGDAATGQVDPTQASGEAIKAARDQAAVPLNEQIASYKQFVEDVATIWYAMVLAYSVDGIQLESGIMPIEAARAMKINIKVDASPTDPYSILSQGITLERMLLQQIITFEEYVEAVDENGSTPKAKLKQILDRRAAQQIPQEIPPEQGEPLGGIEQLLGGMDDEMPDMQSGAVY